MHEVLLLKYPCTDTLAHNSLPLSAGAGQHLEKCQGHEELKRQIQGQWLGNRDWAPLSEDRNIGRYHCFFVELSHPAGLVQADTESVLSTSLANTVHPSLVIP